jgi:hypothetical protein
MAAVREKEILIRRLADLEERSPEAGSGSAPTVPNNNKLAYAGTNDCFIRLRVLLVLQAPRHCDPI